VADGVPVVRGAQLSDRRRFSLSNLVFVSEEKAIRHTGNLAYPGDVIVTQRGTIGQVGLVPDAPPYDRYLLSQSQMKISPDPAKADAEFLYSGAPVVLVETHRSGGLRVRWLQQG